MSSDKQRWEARRTAREVRASRATARAKQEKRLEALAVEILLTRGERADCERRIGLALTTMIDDEGLSMVEALEWCGNSFGAREANKWRAQAAPDPGDVDVATTGDAGAANTDG